jgi:hypothetical protein
MIRYQSGSFEAFQGIYAQVAPGVRRYLSHLAGGSEIADDDLVLHDIPDLLGDNSLLGSQDNHHFRSLSDGTPEGDGA